MQLTELRSVQKWPRTSNSLTFPYFQDTLTVCQKWDNVSPVVFTFVSLFVSAPIYPYAFGSSFSAKFEGSLGKVQVLSANCPRELIDLRSDSGDSSPDAASTNQQPATTGVGTERRGSPFRRRPQPSVAALRRFKLLLLELENLWTLLLTGEQLRAAVSAENTQIELRWAGADWSDPPLINEIIGKG